MDSASVVDIKGSLCKYIQSNCSRLSPADVRIEGCALPRCFVKYTQRLKDFEVKPDDIWLFSYPKCGTTWTQEMIWNLVNDCDFDTAKKIRLPDRFPFIEFSAIKGDDTDLDTIEKARNIPSPRLIKCHLPAHLLPKQLWEVKPKMIYVYRDPRDAAISYYHHLKLWYDYVGTKENIIDAFIHEILPYDPFWSHVLKFWELRDEPYMCFNTFEQMKADLGAVIDKTSKFIGYPITPENKVKLIDHLSFKSMQNNDSVNYKADKATSKFKEVQFIREGKSGGWRTELSLEQINKFDHLAGKYLQEYDFPYYNPYDCPTPPGHGNKHFVVGE